MKRRDSEGKHSFSREFFSSCNIYALQGLLIDKDGRFTAAVEAYELEEADRFDRVLGNVIDPEDFYIKSLIAEKIGVPFFLLIHREGCRTITRYQLKPDREQYEPICSARDTLSEQDFLLWWRQKKQTVQNKPYRADFKARVQESYFDNLLEANGEKWGGNIDGIIVSPRGSDIDVLGIVENRFTNLNTIRMYDPNAYFTHGGGDYYTWLPLVNLCAILNVPLFLCTYSNRPGETHLVGVTCIQHLDETGITYITDERDQEIKPYNNLVSDIPRAYRWMERIFRTP